MFKIIIYFLILHPVLQDIEFLFCCVELFSCTGDSMEAVEWDVKSLGVGELVLCCITCGLQYYLLNTWHV